MFTRILVPTDFSPPSDAALACARTVATQFGASLHLLHVAEDPYRALYSNEVFVAEVEGVRADLVNDASRRMKQQLTAADDERSVTVEAIIGTAATSIVEYAEGHGIDLIVMGTHGRSGMSKVLMGSVAERVVRTAPCPVLTIRETGKPAAAAA